MIHPDTEIRYIDEIIGYGVFATKYIPQGTITWTLCSLDRNWSAGDIYQISPHHRQHLNKYVYLDADERFILCWDHARFINHSCNTNTLSMTNLEIAIRDILPGEQMTCDYSLLNLYQALPCNCDFLDCRKTIHTKDILTYYPIWDDKIQQSLPHIAKVQQPLVPFIQNPATFPNILQKKIPSIKSFFCPNWEKLWKPLQQTV